MNSAAHALGRFLIVAFLFFLFCQPSIALGARLGSIKTERKSNKLDRKGLQGIRREKPWIIAPAISGGYNKLLEGYEDYDDLGNFGLDLYIEPGRDMPYPERWNHNILFRLSFDYFPLQVPKGNLGLKEDMFGLYFSFLYRFRRFSVPTRTSWIPFLGIGIGRYQDRVRLNTAASGQVEGTYNYTGYNGSIGVFTPYVKLLIPVRIAPEIRYHRVRRLEDYATNITYQISIIFWPSRYGDR